MSGLRIIAADRIDDAGGFVLALDLNGDAHDRLDAALHLLDGHDFADPADARADPDRRQEAQAVGADVSLMDDAWWGPTIPLPKGPWFALAERSRRRAWICPEVGTFWRFPD